MAIMNGYLKLIKFGPDAILDITPVDYVTNMVLATSAYAALEPTPCLNIVHASTGQLNPITVGRLVTLTLDFAKKYPSIKQFQEPGVLHLPQRKVYNSHVFIKETLPANLLQNYASLPYIGSKKLWKKSV